ncbi:MAG: hypothetical protein Q4C90_01370 [Kocuria sp.]|uniref:WXG100-like domain-containing protein n=1 Tax=Kocuria sp. TaxID=1871328 RepID=UPI0026DD179A|nr:hypothetical protein [Kocuria sp.]MDO4255815.1 hypothetical protein [Kocuria sp.]
MTPLASSAPPGASPWTLAGLVHERLSSLAARYEAAAEHLDALAARLAELARADGWAGPGSRAFTAWVQRHGQDTRGKAEQCREVADLVRQTASMLGQRIQDVESVLDLGGPLTGALTAVLGPVALGAVLGSGLGSGMNVGMGAGLGAST